MEKRTVIVIGGGAAGLFAAFRAAELGGEVIVLEKMKTPARKLRITGKGRCNLTNVAPLSEFIKTFGKNGRFLRGAFSNYFSKDLISFFEKIDIPTLTERGGRVFPKSGKATEVCDSLLKYVEDQGVNIKTSTSVKKIIQKDGVVTSVVCVDSRGGKEKVLKADKIILATGGASYPLTGSTGDGYKFTEKLGHTIVQPKGALVPLETLGEDAKNLQGLSLKNVNMSVWSSGKKVTSDFGEMIFTHFGVSGPIVLTMSKKIVELLDDCKDVELSIDFKPALDDKKLDARLLRDFAEQNKKQFKTYLRTLLPAKQVAVCIENIGIQEDKLLHQISAPERKKLRLWLKDFRLKVTKSRPIDEAIVTAGGISLSEINKNTMESKIVKNLFFAGEVMDIDAETGGYNLQAAFSTGIVAAESALK